MIPVSLGVLAPAWFSVAGLPALVLTALGVPTHPKIPSVPSYVFGKVQDRYSDEVEYLEEQEAALVAIDKKPDEIGPLLVKGGLKKFKDETDKDFDLRAAKIHQQYYTPSAAFFNCLLDPTRSIDTLADDLKSQIIKTFSDPDNTKNQIHNLFIILYFLTIDNTNSAAINLNMINYRMFAALRIVMKDPCYHAYIHHFKNYVGKLSSSAKDGVLAILDNIENCKNTPILDRMKINTYGHHYLGDPNDPIYQLASQGKEKPKRPPLFSAEWVQANKTPILWALGTIAVCIVVAVALFPPIIGFVGLVGGNAAMLSMGAGVAGMGPMTVGTLMLAITAVLSPLAYLAAKFTHKEEIDRLEVNLAETRELRLMENENCNSMTKPISRFTSWFGTSPKNQPDAQPMKRLKTP